MTALPSLGRVLTEKLNFRLARRLRPDPVAGAATLPVKIGTAAGIGGIAAIVLASLPD